MNEEHDPAMLDRYDFSKGVRGKYAHHYARHRISFSPVTTNTHRLSATVFEEQARQVLSDYFGVDLSPGSVAGVPKMFDLVSADRQIVGDAKNYSLVGGARRPPAKLATISEYVWLLEKTGAPNPFLVFGKDRRVPELWLKDYGSLLSGVTFYFLDNDNRLERLTGSRTSMQDEQVAGMSGRS